MSPKHTASKNATPGNQQADYTAMCLPALPAEPEYTSMRRDESGQNVLCVQQLTESVESMAIMCDNKFNTIKQMPKNTKTEAFNLGKFSILHFGDILVNMYFPFSFERSASIVHFCLFSNERI